jgi:virginiamycin B lyase
LTFRAYRRIEREGKGQESDGCLLRSDKKVQLFGSVRVRACDGLGRLAIAGLLLCGVPAGAVTFKEYPLPAGSQPTAITLGPDGNIWFAEPGTNKIGRITPAGQITHFDIPTPSSFPTAITAGPDGRIWFTELVGNKIGALSMTGGVPVEYTSASIGQPTGITAGPPPGSLWFTNGASSFYCRISVAGSVGHCTDILKTQNGIAATPDGYIFLTYSDGVAREDDLSACLTSSTCGGSGINNPVMAGSFPRRIAPGRDGSLWFAEETSSTIGRLIASTNAIAEFPTLTSAAVPSGVTFAPDATIWFTESAANKIGRMSTTGTGQVEYPVPTSNSGPNDLTWGPDGSIWFTEETGDKIGRLKPNPNGDVNGDGIIAVADVFYLINFLFAGGPVPNPF